MNLEIEQILSKTIQIKSPDIYKTNNIDKLILHKLKHYECKCSEQGYIMKDTTEIIQRSMGKICSIDKKSMIEYKINYKIKSILPTIGDKYNCIIGSITKMGLICYTEFEGSTSVTDTPLLIIIPREYCNLEKLKVDDKIEIITVDLRIKFMSPQIQLIGKIVD
tara:strand:+ start:23 stop:514 length:492 start_codon:yes stop_codon:yes gene_type:complete